MRLLSAALAVSLVTLLASASGQAKSNLSDDQVRERMIQESLGTYNGPCPCPYNTMRNGTSCGNRSAYSKPGGASPLCYKKDISDEAVRGWRRKNGE